MTAARAPRRPASRARADARSKKGGLAVVLTTGLGSDTFHPLPLVQWRSSVRHAVTQRADDRYFAEKCLPPGEYERWLELDPTITEFAEFLGQLTEQSGEDLGESKASQ